MKRPRSIRGRKYKSKFESDVAKKLSNLGFKHNYETEYFPYILEKTYNPDFTLDGTSIILEVKGVLDTQARSKMKAVKEQHPDADIRFVFMKPHNRCPGMKMTHAQWAEKYGYPWYALEDLNKKVLK